jgi:hypothetical protein
MKCSTSMCSHTFGHVVWVQKAFPIPISTNHFCMDLTLCMGALSCWNRKGPSPNCCHKDGNTESSRMSLYVAALRFLFTGPKGPEPWKTVPDHYSYSRVQWRRVLQHSSQCLGMVILGLCGCSAMDTHFMKILTNSYCADVASRGRLDLGSDVYRSARLSTQLSRCVSLCGLPLRVWAVVAPRHFQKFDKLTCHIER